MGHPLTITQDKYDEMIRLIVSGRFRDGDIGARVGLERTTIVYHRMKLGIRYERKRKPTHEFEVKPLRINKFDKITTREVNVGKKSYQEYVDCDIERNEKIKI